MPYLAVRISLAAVAILLAMLALIGCSAEPEPDWLMRDRVSPPTEEEPAMNRRLCDKFRHLDYAIITFALSDRDVRDRMYADLELMRGTSFHLSIAWGDALSAINSHIAAQRRGSEQAAVAWQESSGKDHKADFVEQMQRLKMMCDHYRSG